MMAHLTRTKTLSVTFVTAGLALVPAVAAHAATTTCDAYSGKCTTVQGTKIVKTPQTNVEGTNSTLPFTGGEIVLMSVAGTALVGGGVVLVAAGRRRRAAAAPA